MLAGSKDYCNWSIDSGFAINQYQGGTVFYRSYHSTKKKKLALTEHEKYKSEKEKN